MFMIIYDTTDLTTGETTNLCSAEGATTQESLRQNGP
jgi:hypothetical protein